jgi:hypothetical protein
MGKTPKPLVILLTDPAMLQWPVFQKLEAQGHQITSLNLVIDNYEAWEPDIVFGPTAHYLVPEMEKYVDEALKAARGRKYQPKERK